MTRDRRLHAPGTGGKSLCGARGVEIDWTSTKINCRRCLNKLHPETVQKIKKGDSL